jgi:hypothetical protein
MGTTNQKARLARRSRNHHIFTAGYTDEALTLIAASVVNQEAQGVAAE